MENSDPDGKSISQRIIDRFFEELEADPIFDKEVSKKLRTLIKPTVTLKAFDVLKALAEERGQK